MKIPTIDPISLNDVIDLDGAPFVVEGKGKHAMVIYFESEGNRKQYLDTPIVPEFPSLSAVNARPPNSDVYVTTNQQVSP